MAVDPASARFARQRILPGFGVDAQRALANAHVVVIGAGGLGSAVLPALAAAGVGTLSIVDDDTVEASNLHRQTLHGIADLGRAKVDSARESLAALSPETVVRTVAARFAAGTAAELLEGADLLIDGGDTAATRYLADDAATARGIPLVWGSALRFWGQVGVAWDARAIRYRDLIPEPAGGADTADSCEVAGVLPSVCAVIGAMMATEAIKLLTGVGEPLLGRVAAYDALTGSVTELSYARDPAAPRPYPTAPLVTTPAVEPLDLRRRLAGIHDTPPVLLDVRDAEEVSLAALPGAVHIPLAELPDRFGELDPTAPLVVYCHRGVRSASAVELLREAGFARVEHLARGIDAWSVAVDPGVPRY